MAIIVSWDKIESLVNNKHCGKNRTFGQKVEIWMKNPSFAQKPNFWLKIQVLVKNLNFG